GASAGMLAPLAEASHHSRAMDSRSSPFLTLTLAGLQAHPPWLERLRAETGLDVGPHGPGMLRVAGEEEVEALQASTVWQRELGLPFEWLTAPDLKALEPSLEGCAAAVLSPQEQHVQPPLVVQALAQTATA